jgi:nitroimidazol reductase NimA-like FMN-containing flavoprotein (pyridoxamine 5'-phosphate oxidase superfamily)
MTTFEANPVVELIDRDSWNLLASVALGRLATSVAGQPEIFPVNFVVQQHTILLRTAEGTKLLNALVNEQVAFEADDHDVEEGWSVVVKGRAYVLGASEFAEAERGQVLPWTTTAKNCFIRIVPIEISGRRFRFGGEHG